ncbi:hypothetical protein [Streptomyces sp. NPDC053431]|uniref:hypothetical protein n=1 Tax=Streptomyces sp. NPDC053431 TaxID=3365703 RepID=UPI0037CFC8B9
MNVKQFRNNSLVPDSAQNCPAETITQSHTYRCESNWHTSIAGIGYIHSAATLLKLASGTIGSAFDEEAVAP